MQCAALIVDPREENGGNSKQERQKENLWGSTCAYLHFLSFLSNCFRPLTETGHREDRGEERD